MRKHKRLFIDFIGAPGAGKSTLCAYAFAHLKLQGVRAEMVTEPHKLRCYTDRKGPPTEEELFEVAEAVKFLGLSNIEVVVSDGVLSLAKYYQGVSFDEFFKGFEYRQILVTRDKPYVSLGRLQKQHEADKIASRLEEVHPNPDLRVLSWDTQSVMGYINKEVETLSEIL